ncbi:glycosyltransferase family 2 protein [Desulfovibrio sp. OttesenSCG-928-A18]|nr:glycosyltransferase family 2 protein [Desulfovibrio sp. OttesenSCG-928-A18]
MDADSPSAASFVSPVPSTERACPPADATVLAPGITGVVLTHNGERLLRQCLSSLAAFCDVILCVDSGSADASQAIAAEYGASFVHRDWEGFDRQFSYAQALVNTRWFFILDQDEICPLPLGRKIRKAIDAADAAADTPQDSPVAFSVGRRSWYFDRFMKHSGWYPDHILRVFRTGFVEFYQDAHIHYRPLGGKEHLGGPGAEIVHYPYTGFAHQLAKISSYADQGAAALRARGKKGGVARGIVHGFSRFLRIYILKRGFLDGKAGFLAACHGSFYAFLKYVRVLDASWGEPFDEK